MLSKFTLRGANMIRIQITQPTGISWVLCLLLMLYPSLPKSSTSFMSTEQYEFVVEHLVYIIVPRLPISTSVLGIPILYSLPLIR